MTILPLVKVNIMVKVNVLGWLNSPSCSINSPSSINQNPKIAIQLIESPPDSPSSLATHSRDLANQLVESSSDSVSSTIIRIRTTCLNLLSPSLDSSSSSVCLGHLNELSPYSSDLRSILHLRIENSLLKVKFPTLPANIPSAKTLVL